MRIADEWTDYELIDTSAKERLERWKDQYIIRPDPQILWNGRKTPLWNDVSARYHRSREGGGHWETKKAFQSETVLSYKSLRFKVKPTGFKHMGLFPEQAVNWDLLTRMLPLAKKPLQILNLFAYTGGATLACALAGASVCHVDAAKGMVSWARENAALSSLQHKPIRWIVDDCEKFALRELRRDKQYDAIILDPPSYGRGPGGEIWKLEKKIDPLLQLCKKLLSPSPAFVLLNSYTTGLSPSVMKYLLQITFGDVFSFYHADEIGLPVKETGFILPCGATAIALRKEFCPCLPL